MQSSDIIDNYPYLFHMAEAGSWPSISVHGLLSTSALLDLFEITGAKRFKIESMRRPASVKIRHSRYGEAVVRDQIPLRERPLQSCLDGMSPQEWYETLNSRVFFWLTRNRLNRLLTARAYRNKAHCIITVPTKDIIERHSSDVRLSAINSGSTIFSPIARGPQTFQAIEEYPFESRRKTAGLQNAIAELAVNRGVKDIRDFVVRVEHVRGDEVLEVIYDREAAQPAR